MDKPWEVSNDRLIHIVEVFVLPGNLKEAASYYKSIGLKLESYTVDHKGYQVVFRREWYG